ncbi:uncharacterized protein LOC111614835 isoform X2 [Centruroides sculpturatus]|uniref:uncharacterized protein LOC111614835 isoform X2 n=1 Tax=Centruroides sculpturatus TaxID=218467 RepID=UPI000C6D579A|nr:uncharacterized protein LOC111614835 isoform X2 [Centruroides sculpturatus]
MILYILNTNMPKINKKKLEYVQRIVGEVKDSDTMLREIFPICFRVSECYVGMPYGSHLCPKKYLREYCKRMAKSVSLKISKRLQTSLKYELEVKVIEALNLKSKNIKDQTNPFCKIWIHQNKVKTSKVVVASVDPNWDEEFVFKNIINEDALTIEIWNASVTMLRDCETRQKRIYSLLRCFKIKKSNPRICSDDLIGVTTIQIQEIPFVNEEGDLNNNAKVLKLNLNGIETGGKIIIDMKIRSDTDKDIVISIGDHIKICKFFLQKHLTNKDIDVNSALHLPELFHPEEWTILKQHAIQSNLFPLNHYICIWLCISRLLRKYRIRYNYILMTNFLNKINSIRDSIIEPDSFMDKIFLDEMKCMVNNSIARLDQMHIFMGFEEKIDVELLRPFLQFLKSLSIFNCYMTEEIQFALQQNAEKYNCLLLRSIWAKKDSDEELKQLEHVLEVLRHNHQKLDETFVNVFGNMTYSQHVYINLNVLLYKTCHKLIERHVRISYMNNDQDKLKKMLRIYFMLKQLIENTLRNIENVQNRPRLEMENFCNWFGDEILKAWFNQVAREAKILIRNNIEKNYVNILSQSVISGLPTKHLNSIIFDKVIRFWKELDWTDVTAIEIMINCLNDCILEYYDGMLRKIKKEHIPLYKCNLNVSNEMRLIINNMTEITKCIENVIEVIEKDLTNKLTTESRKYLTGPLRNIIAKAKSEMLSCSKYAIQSAKLQACEMIQNIINSKPGKVKQNNTLPFSAMAIISGSDFIFCPQVES